MTPQEKAKQLYDKFVYMLPDTAEISKQDIQELSLFVVDEILDIIEDDGFTFAEYHDKKTIEFWFEVKKEINNL
jgi:hypothetical protein